MSDKAKTVYFLQLMGLTYLIVLMQIVSPMCAGPATGCLFTGIPALLILAELAFFPEP